jgi:hypothetical protein
MPLCLNPLSRIISLCAGHHLATTKQSMMEGGKKERRRSVPLPTTTAATAATARKKASSVIGEVLQQAGTSRTSPATERMETSQSGSAGIPYRNFHTEGAANGAHPLPPVSGRREFIRIQRQIRGKHATSGTGPSVDQFRCGNFEDDGTSFENKSFTTEDAAELLIGSTSFSRSDWVCMSCDIDHKLLPKKRNKQQWTRGRKLVILTDQNFPAAALIKTKICQFQSTFLKSKTVPLNCKSFQSSEANAPVSFRETNKSLSSTGPCGLDT